MHFTLIGYPTLIFKTVKVYKAAGFIPSVVGISLDGTKQTVARIEDVNLVADVELTA